MAATRRDRALQQRILLVDVNLDDSTGDVVCTVLGASGTQYSVKLDDEQFVCTCPDHKIRHAFCKHMIFVGLRVMRLTQTCMDALQSEQTPTVSRVWREACVRWFQRLHSGTQADQKYSQPNVCRTCTQRAPAAGLTRAGKLYDTCCRDCAVSAGARHSSACVQTPASGSTTQSQQRQSETCAICIDDFQSGDASTACGACGNDFHTQCLSRWKAATRVPTCPLCRHILS